MLSVTSFSLVIAACMSSLHVAQAGDTCYDSYTGIYTYCSGFGAYCCGWGTGTCCYNSWYSTWWIWMVIVFILVSLSLCCGYYRRRRMLQSRRIIYAQPVAPVYGTVSTVTTSQYPYPGPSSIAYQQNYTQTPYPKPMSPPQPPPYEPPKQESAPPAYPGGI